MSARVPTLTMCRGLPASGKSTWADAQVLAAKPGTVVRVNRDTLRDMLHAGRWAKGRTEGQTLKALDALIGLHLDQGIDVIVDDTNLREFHHARLVDLARRHGAQFAIQDFTDVSLATCIARDLARPRSVGEAVIRQLYDAHLKPAPATLATPPEATPAILVDLDGTLALMDGRSPFEWHRVGEDRPNLPVILTVRALAATGVAVVYLSGRDGSCRDATEAWLAAHVGVPGPLHMRASGDTRKDAIVKRELFHTHVESQHQVLFVIDDRRQVVEMWRDELGLTCFQVAPGEF